MNGVMSYYLNGKHVETRTFSCSYNRKQWMRRVIKTVGISNYDKLVFIIAHGVSFKNYKIKYELNLKG